MLHSNPSQWCNQCTTLLRHSFDGMMWFRDIYTNDGSCKRSEKLSTCRCILCVKEDLRLNTLLTGLGFMRTCKNCELIENARKAYIAVSTAPTDPIRETPRTVILDSYTSNAQVYVKNPLTDQYQCQNLGDYRPWRQTPLRIFRRGHPFESTIGTRNSSGFYFAYFM